jgi:hypothetical protein
MGEGNTASQPGMPLADWPQRPWILAALLGAAGLLIHLFTGDNPETPWRISVAAALFFGAMAAAFTLQKDRWKEPAIFAPVIALAMAGLTYQAAQAGERVAGEEYGFAAGVFASLLALPLFQAGFLRLRFDTPYKETHFHVWTDAITGAGALVFTGISWALVAILATLFDLIGIDILEQMLDEGWFGWTFSGIAFGAALGTLRNQLKIIGTLQSVVLLVLSLLAVPLAVALVIFLLAMVLSGPEVLWNATESATPVLLTIAIGAFVLANSVIRDDEADMSHNPAMRWSAFVLALCILPLTIFAAVSMGTRVAQHGLSPERLWAVISIAVACAFGLAYLVGVVRGRLARWPDFLRRANLHLSAAVCVLALLLALPILDFGGISAANQISRFKAGKVSAEDFDYTALRWDFGDGGRRALRKLAQWDDPEVAKEAKLALAQDERPWRGFRNSNDSDERLANLRVETTDERLRERVRQQVRNTYFWCEKPCVALEVGETRNGERQIAIVEGRSVRHIAVRLDGAEPQGTGDFITPPMELVWEKGPEVTADSEVEIRPWTGRRVYVDGEPVGEPFE